LALYPLIWLVPVASALHHPSPEGSSSPQSTPPQSKVIQLDQNGDRGIVPFDHTRHEPLLNPDPASPHKAKAGAACSGCHHTISVRGTPQLWKCTSCHRGEGDQRNPRNRDQDELYSERAFHQNCIPCHRANNSATGLNKAPTTCGGCHKAKYQQGSLVTPERRFEVHSLDLVKVRS
ncbi:MAG TPA: cytochrome c3 family protein, partial [Blastocatellia bacterium]|nr:cytochrome c3 family protein [Blastocatellia bacterium]